MIFIIANKLSTSNMSYIFKTLKQKLLLTKVMITILQPSPVGYELRSLRLQDQIITTEQTRHHGQINNLSYMEYHAILSVYTFL
jgi:hypothetical protein